MAHNDVAKSVEMFWVFYKGDFGRIRKIEDPCFRRDGVWYVRNLHPGCGCRPYKLGAYLPDSKIVRTTRVKDTELTLPLAQREYERHRDDSIY